MANEGKIALGVTAAILLIGLATRPAKAAPGLADVTGLVSDQFVDPLPAATVTLGELVTSTDSTGVFEFVNVPTGAYSMSFSKSGYDTVYL